MSKESAGNLEPDMNAEQSRKRSDRTIEVCPHAEICGGCTYQGVPYDEQLEIKNTFVLEQLLRQNIRCGEYIGMKPSPNLTAYRNKMEYSFGDDIKDGPMTLGLHRKKSYMSVIEPDDCRIVPKDFDLIRRAVLRDMTARGHSFRHKRTHRGFLRNLTLRRGERTGEILINLITSSDEVLNAEAFVSLIQNLPLENEIAGIIHTTYDGRADTAGCDSYKVLYGKDHYFEEMLGLRFRVGAYSFFQTNTSAAETLFEDALKMIPGATSKKVYDLYCGAGTISLALARSAAEVTGIEIIEDSVISARENAQINNLKNCTFIRGDAFEVLEALEGKPDVIVVDPPRMGMHPKALKKIISYDLPEILYISCNPTTFADNMAVLQVNGYKLDMLRAYDNFPYTKHIELAARIIRLPS
ncbi:MAG: 23S rRNA (uracil(1939)-C(5))-methyltransferase RlmD [Clostridiales Family XIII bacterium]|jgi:23S rRNA (uracil-5-)-methyltransferase RumA|nr:23S rRNA (uracil(1939)-C(5))-methyltransferase RlmD [Clostridiales Family XIII bacterium]